MKKKISAPNEDTQRLVNRHQDTAMSVNAVVGERPSTVPSPDHEGRSQSEVDLSAGRANEGAKRSGGAAPSLRLTPGAYMKTDAARAGMSARMKEVWARKKAEAAARAGLPAEALFRNNEDDAVDFDLSELGGGVDENDVRASPIEDAPLPIERVVAEELVDEAESDAGDAGDEPRTNPAATPERLELIKQAHARYLERRAAAEAALDSDGEAA